MTFARSTAASPEIRALEENAWSMWTMFGRGPGCRLVDTDEVMAYETPIARFPYNMVFRFRVGAAAADARLAAVLAPYRSRGAPLAWLVHPTSAPADLRDRLAAQGLRRGEIVKGMTLRLDSLPPPAPPPPGVDVFEGTASEVDDWMRLVSWRYDLPADTAATLEGLYRLAIGDPDRRTRWWGARRGEHPLSKAVLHTADGVAGIYGVATVEEGRGLGLASLLTLVALEEAKRRGCTLAVLHATPMAAGLYERLGFETACDFEVWADPGHLHL
jgi:ribosomal protein S18 acetylase RimI-like enzyme